MKPLASIEHRLPRRTRMKVPSMAGDRPFFAQLAEALKREPQVSEVGVNVAVGGLTVRHDAGTRIQDLAAIRDRLTLTDLPASLLPRSSPPRRARMGRTEAVSAGLLTLSAIQLFRGRITGSASENFWNAYRAHAHLRNRWLTLGLLGLGAVQISRGQVLNSASSLLVYALTVQALEEEAARAEIEAAEVPTQSSETANSAKLENRITL